MWISSSGPGSSGKPPREPYRPGEPITVAFFRGNSLCNSSLLAHYSGFDANLSDVNVGLRYIPIYVATAILAACGQVPEGRVSVIPGDTGSLDSAVRYEAADRSIPLVIRGNPFTGTQEDAVAAITSVLRLPPGWPRASFASTPEAERGRGVRLVLVFEPRAPRIEARELCRNAEIETAEHAGTTRIFAAFCIGQKLSVGASVVGAAPATMNPEFNALLGSVLQNVSRLRTPRVGSIL